MSLTGTTTPNGDPDSVRVPGTTTAAAAVSTSAYVRQAKPSDIPALVAVYVRAFARDPAMNWFGGVRTLVPADYHQRQHNRPHRRRRFFLFRRGQDDKGGDSQTLAENEGDARARRTMEALGHFELMIVKIAQISGNIVVAVEKESEEAGEGGEGKEKIVGGALWLRPGSSIDPSPLMLMRISPWSLRVLWNWGLGTLKRMTFNYAPTVNKIFDEAFAERGLKSLDSWHLFEIAVDPACEGKGYCSLLMREGLQRAAGKPVSLEASTPRSRDIYAHFGFELNKEHRFGVGSVDEMGVVAKGETAAGVPMFIMTKWENP